jgi:hypothetical protein
VEDLDDGSDSPAARCGRGVFVSRDKSTGALRSRPLFCKTWACDRCSKFLKDKARAHARHCLHGRKHIWCALVKGEPSMLRSTIKQRRRRLAKKLGVDVQYLVAANSLYVVILSTHSLAGSTPPEQFMNLEVDVALTILDACLRAPGVTRTPSTSTGWNRTSCALCQAKAPPKETKLRPFGSPARLDDAFQVFSDDVEAMTGVIPELDLGPPPGISLADWVALTEKHFGPKT